MEFLVYGPWWHTAKQCRTLQESFLIPLPSYRILHVSMIQIHIVSFWIRRTNIIPHKWHSKRPQQVQQEIHDVTKIRTNKTKTMHRIYDFWTCHVTVVTTPWIVILSDFHPLSVIPSIKGILTTGLAKRPYTNILATSLTYEMWQLFMVWVETKVFYGRLRCMPHQHWLFPILIPFYNR